MEMNNTCLNISPQLEKYYLPTMYGLEFILGFIGNISVIWGYMFCLKEWKCSNIYLFNLSITDLTFICTLPMLVAYYGRGNKWTFGQVMCILNRYILHTNMYTSILFLCCISFDRYLLVMRPLQLHSFQKKWNAVIVCLGIWIFVTLELVPIFTFLQINTDNSTDHESILRCLDYASSGDASRNLIYSLYLTVFGFLAPLSVMLFFYIQTVRGLRKIQQQRTKIQVEKPLKLVILAIVIFLVFFTPYHIMRNVRIASRIENNRMSECGKLVVKAVYAITRPIAFLNSITNPIFYFMLGDKFRELFFNKLKSIFFRKPVSSNQNEDSSTRPTGLNTCSEAIIL
ncbi:succinate receptor 1-like isoform X1 [Carcharodon carcharias]|uniref:succinate receptor 1-like isoform X1 n=2 Tax=Carcharodon carcharias TaxID=13397 RepID=UPI001B7E2ECA|nr:succinate receptor 1-like isoform X1 [Carcharodon carcharias]XP_041038901.1 succinate receptor 1-like isoform X1 [Carcharodon carcharias]XP_041038902.1 succinate receptor 1-like isoform X1 [Carcharodon carcharias]XP_041038903.1 succinate receptor 1-like isoform X1 [Carcharodon carcharias]XP_041038904.1 succinate receptor 1-like isoform X1 [Carcharodon carcharias]XP_041038905.1 succinate receptor 1-like isoform X1 [Carcharodon carcharias]XP_041038906.1 succinate receptor 1-like isoform X1 [